MKRFLLLAVVLAGLLAGTAQAAPFTPELEADYASGLAYWNVASPPQCASVTEELLPTDPFRTEDGVDAAMRATQPPPGEVVACILYGFEDALQTLSPCTKEVLARHEVGHLLGKGHSGDPTSIMHAPPEPSFWCPGEAPIPPRAAEADVGAESTAARKTSWGTWRAMRRTCRAARGPHRPKCFAELRDLREFLQLA